MSDRLLTDEEIDAMRQDWYKARFSIRFKALERVIVEAQDKRTASIVRQEMVEEIEEHMEMKVEGLTYGIMLSAKEWQELKRKWGVK